jgi:hypothetical protein
LVLPPPGNAWQPSSPAAPAASFWLLLAAPWLLLAAPWLLLAAPDSFLNAPGGSSGSIWEHLGASWSIWEHLRASSSIWEHQLGKFPFPARKCACAGPKAKPITLSPGQQDPGLRLRRIWEHQLGKFPLPARKCACADPKAKPITLSPGQQDPGLRLRRGQALLVSNPPFEGGTLGG